jgi:hypothetical protein
MESLRLADALFLRLMLGPHHHHCSIYPTCFNVPPQPVTNKLHWRSSVNMGDASFVVFSTAVAVPEPNMNGGICQTGRSEFTQEAPQEPTKRSPALAQALLSIAILSHPRMIYSLNRILLQLLYCLLGNLRLLLCYRQVLQPHQSLVYFCACSS